MQFDCLISLYLFFIASASLPAEESLWFECWLYLVNDLQAEWKVQARFGKTEHC